MSMTCSFSSWVRRVQPGRSVRYEPEHRRFIGSYRGAAYRTPNQGAVSVYAPLMIVMLDFLVRLRPRSGLAAAVDLPLYGAQCEPRQIDLVHLRTIDDIEPA